MSSLRIDQNDGTVDLPNGRSIGPHLSQDAILASLRFAGARSPDYGAPPSIPYHLSGGHIDGKELLVSLCFYDQMLVDVSITADLYPPGTKDWSSYSLDVESATKQFHDRLLAEMFGSSSTGGTLFAARLPDGRATLEQPLSWRFPWGVVYSFHDSKGGGTYITVSYGRRGEEANEAYRSRWPE